MTRKDDAFGTQAIRLDGEGSSERVSGYFFEAVERVVAIARVVRHRLASC